MQHFRMLWMLLVALGEIYTDYLFSVLELIMENSLGADLGFIKGGEEIYAKILQFGDISA